MIYSYRPFNQINRRAFSIVELLVVITIVAMLMALILPSLKQAREIAILLKCSALTRSIALGTSAYSVDFKNQIPPHLGYNTGTQTLFQGDKSPGGYWWYQNGGGMQRAGLLWPGYVTNSEAFYCPSTTGYATNSTYQTYHHNWAKAGIGTTTGQSVAITSYAYPAVTYRNCDNGYGGAWTGIANQYWTHSNGYSAYGVPYWSTSMLKPRVEDNTPTMPLSWDLNQGGLEMHGGNSASVAFLDGSAIQFHKVRYLNAKLIFTFGVGMGHPEIVPTLRAYRERGILP